MTIKTAVTLTAGAAVGFLLGCFTDQKTKEKIVSGVKDKIVYALTGEHIRKKAKPGPVTYRDYFYEKKKNREDEKKGNESSFSWKVLEKQIFEFDSFEDACNLRDMMKQLADKYKAVTVRDVMALRENLPMALSWYWDSYGWNAEEIETSTVVGGLNDPSRKDIPEKWQIIITNPKKLY